MSRAGPDPTTGKLFRELMLRAVSVAAAALVIVGCFGVATARSVRAPTGAGSGPGEERQQPGATAANRQEASKAKAREKVGGFAANAESVVAKLQQNERLKAKLESLLPPGTDLTQAAEGFTRLEDFVASAHVFENLGIPLTELKPLITGKRPLPLASAIRRLNPNISAQSEERRALQAARKDLREAAEVQQLARR